MSEEFFDGVDDEAILPEGGDTLYVSEDMSSTQQDGLDEAQNDEPVDSNAISEDEAITIGDESEEKENGEAESDEQVPDGEPEIEKKPRRIKTKFDHKEEYYTLDDMSDEEIATAFQKSRMFDRMTQRESDRIRQEVYDAQIEAGMTESVANLVADMEAKNYRYQDDSADNPAEEVEDTTPDFKSEVKDLKAKYPDVKSIPDEVMNEYLQTNTSLSDAYGRWEIRQAKNHAAAIEKENKILRQNAASAAKAPVTGVRGGGKITEKKDDFLAGLDSDAW